MAHLVFALKPFPAAVLAILKKRLDQNYSCVPWKPTTWLLFLILQPNFQLLRLVSSPMASCQLSLLMLQKSSESPSCSTGRLQPVASWVSMGSNISSRKDRLTPLKDESYLTNGYLETVIDWIPEMKGIRLKDFPTMVRTTDPNNILFMFTTKAAQRSHKVSHIIVHTFDELEASIVHALSSCMFPHLYTIGPLQLLLDQIPEEEKQTEMSNFNGYSLRKEEPECFQWLQSKEPKSMIYVNFGTSVVMSLEDLIEFGWGLVNSNHYFLWIIRSNLIVGESVLGLPPELEEHIKKRGFIASWCSQEKVLNHPSVGGFLTHGGWGSTIESLSAGVPMICWPFMWDQPTNCWYICTEWEVGLEMGKEVKREEVKKLVQELMGEGGDRMRNKAMEWKEKAEIATGDKGSSSLNVDNLVNEIIMLSRN